MKSIEQTVRKLTVRSRKASRILAGASESQINKALKTMKRLLIEQKSTLDRANRKDLRAGRNKGLAPAMLDRLTLSDKAIKSMTNGLTTLTKLTSTVGQISDHRTRPNGLEIYKLRVPIGVVGIIFESRPNVTVDAAAICLKSKNAVILRGGSEAFHSNTALAKLFATALADAGLPSDAVLLVPTTDRVAVSALLSSPDTIDLIIPRGGESLIRRVVQESQIPVIKHYKGICHVFVSRHGNMRIAEPLIVNAKVHRPGVCNAMETLLLDKGLPERDRKKLIEALQAQGVTLIGDAASGVLGSGIAKATPADWEAEYLDLRLAVRTVDGVDDAIAHINRYGSHHTDAIVSRSKQEIEHFINDVDSSSVMVNASTRFADGGEYGMGCEIGISTDKLHARGPMGIEDLTTYKWIVKGTGQIRA